MSTLSGKTVLVIGGSSGIGFAVALGSLKSNAERVIIASSSQDRVANALERLKARYTTETGSSAEGRVDSRVIDVTNHAAVKALFAELGEIDHLVLTYTGNSFIFGDFKEFDLSSAKARSPMDSRYWSSLQAAQSAQIKPGGSITFTIGLFLRLSCLENAKLTRGAEGSVFHNPIKKYSLNVGSTGALDAATRALAVELAPIRVNILWDRFPIPPPGGREEFIRKLNKYHLVGHVGTPEEVAEAYLFLMKCGFITGETIKVEGGRGLEAVLQF
ncbi:NAD(P)-binding protein [Fistulina hepatica ATCC 64428]|uniref:NAD(P)-binding protein n=1 Tax=Fistulina hepatica ATCC 64428 TaxID=1128425 RepID=A0A0D7AIR2_9AGAR|nr:NAD(P)-binding protein [Fistulina hepatica ATCC 64428]